MLTPARAPLGPLAPGASVKSTGGIGEPSTALAAGSLVNAVFAATGKRIYKLPIKPEVRPLIMKQNAARLLKL